MDNKQAPMSRTLASATTTSANPSASHQGLSQRSSIKTSASHVSKTSASPGRRSSTTSTTLLSHVYKSLAFFYGLFTLTFFYSRAIYAGYLTDPPSPGFWDEVERERERMWALDEKEGDVDGMPGFYHAFETCEGVKVKYLINRKEAQQDDFDNGAESDLVLFVHGWPDSSFVWREVMLSLDTTSPNTTSRQTLVALDLPGHGGSQSLERYGPDEVFECVFHFICAMRKKYLQGKSGKLVLVGFDWGAAIASRIGAEAPECIDEVVLTNGPIPIHALNRLQTVLASSLTHLHFPYMHLSPFLTTLSPALAQLARSSYIFAYNLPRPLLLPLGTLGSSWWLRIISTLAITGSTKPPTAGTNDEKAVLRHLAEMIGPGITSCRGYDGSVLARAQDPRGRFFESVRLYREGLASGVWTQSAFTLSSRETLASSPLMPMSVARSSSISAQKGALRVPTTMLWSLSDQALDARICLDGIEEFLPQGSTVVELGNEFRGENRRVVSHWTPIRAAGVVAGVVGWVIQGKKAELLEAIEGTEKGLRVVVQK